MRTCSFRGKVFNFICICFPGNLLIDSHDNLLVLTRTPGGLTMAIINYNLVKRVSLKNEKPRHTIGPTAVPVLYEITESIYSAGAV